jgi:DNA-binding NtrC family response regulator
MRLEPCNFLLVDDEKGFIDTLAKRLRQRGFSADCAYSGQAALDRLDEEPDLIDVILLDIKMPELNGIETLALLKEKHPLPEVIMLTGHGSVASAVEALKKGAFDYLTKPCDLDDVLSKAERAVARKKERAAKIREIQAIPFISDRERKKRIVDVFEGDGVNYGSHSG